MYEAQCLVLYMRGQSLLMDISITLFVGLSRRVQRGHRDQSRAQAARGTAPQSAGFISASRPEQVASQVTHNGGIAENLQ